jgi:hypothetical protein
MNPIYIDYYSHEGCDCYKIDLPWTDYKKDTRVLCPVDRGLEFASTLAIGVILQHLTEELTGTVKICGSNVGE